MMFGLFTLALVASPSAHADTLTTTTCDPELIAYFQSLSLEDPTPTECVDLTIDLSGALPYEETCRLTDVDLYLVVQAPWAVLRVKGLIAQAGGTPPAALLVSTVVNEHTPKVPEKDPRCATLPEL